MRRIVGKRERFAKYKFENRCILPHFLISFFCSTLFCIFINIARSDVVIHVQQVRITGTWYREYLLKLRLVLFLIESLSLHYIVCLL